MVMSLQPRVPPYRARRASRGQPLRGVIVLSCALSYVGRCPAAGDPIPQPLPAARVAAATTRSGVPQSNQVQDAWTKQRSGAWLAALKPTGRVEGVPLVSDVDLTQDPPSLLPYLCEPPAKGIAAMRALAAALGRRWITLKGVQVFVRTHDPRANGIPADVPVATLQGLAGESHGDMARLIAGTERFDQLDPTLQDTLLTDLGVGSFSHIPQLALRPGNVTTVQLWFAPMLSWTDAKTGIRITRGLPGIEKPPTQAADLNQVGAVPPPAAELSSPLVFDRGPLDFGDGQILTLGEILRRAGAVFGKAYELDGRLSDSRCFIRGSFTAESFEASIDAVSQADPLRLAVRQPHDGASLREARQNAMIALLNGAASALLERPISTREGSLPMSPLQVMTGGEMRLADMGWNECPEMSEEFQRYGLTAQSVVSVQPGVFLSIDAGGGMTYIASQGAMVQNWINEGL